MELTRENLVSPPGEVPVVEGELVTAIRQLADRGWGSRAIARELSIARNTVRRYTRGAPAGLRELLIGPIMFTPCVERGHHVLRFSGRLGLDAVFGGTVVVTGKASPTGTARSWTREIPGEVEAA
jgi:hypothetical protein